MASTADLVTNSVVDLRDDNDESKNATNSFKNMSFKEKWAYTRELVTIEPLLCLYSLASIVCGPAITNLRIEMACSVNAGYNDTTCEAILHDTRETDTWVNHSSRVNQYQTDMSSWCTPIQSAVPVIYLIFLGTYSDRHKIRKPFLLIPIIGELFACICCILCVIFKKSWPVEVEGVAQVIVPSFFGGPEMVYMAAYAYISDISTPEKRVTRIAMLQLFINIASPIGLIFTALLFPIIGYIPSFILGFVFFLLAFVYGILKVKEPKQSIETMNRKSLILDIFNPQHALETLKLVVKTKESQRKNIIFILGVLSIIGLVNLGEGNLLGNFFNHAYGWDGTDLTYYLAAAFVIGLIGIGAGIPLLSTVLGLHDLIIIAVALADKIVANIVLLTVRTSCGVYMSTVAGILSVAALVGIRSQSSKYVSEDDMGKIQSLLLIVGFIAGLIGIEIYNHAIWKYTDTTFSQAFFIGAIILYIPTIAVLVWKYCKEKNEPPIEVLGGPDEGWSGNGTEMKKTET